MFSFGWDLDLELFKSCNESIHSLTRDIELTRYDERSFSPLRNLRGLEITDIALKWNFYCDLDEDFLPIDQKNYILKELILTFQKTHKLQISPINYDYSGGEIKNIRYGSENEMLILLNSHQKIHDEEAG